MRCKICQKESDSGLCEVHRLYFHTPEVTIEELVQHLVLVEELCLDLLGSTGDAAGLTVREVFWVRYQQMKKRKQR